MNYNEIINKKKLVDNYLRKKKTITILDALLINIEGNYLYITINYYKKYKVYKIDWINLSLIENKEVDNWINSNLIYIKSINLIKDIITNNGMCEEYIDEDNIDSNIIINSYLKDYNYNINRFEFKRYIPSCWSFLADIMQIVFENMPKTCYVYFQIMIEKLIKPEKNTVFAFDMKKGDIDSLFEPLIINQGKKYFDNNISFVERIDNITYAVIKDNQNYLTSINYNDVTKELQLGCTCEYNHFCKHMYAALLALKKKKKKKFYKISYVDNSKSIIDNLKNFNYFLCIGIIQDYFIVVIDYNLELLPILDNNKLNFKIIEDDKDHNLEIDLQKYLEKHR